MLENLRSRLGVGASTRRYVDVETVSDLEAISDPETATDETSQSWRSWASENKALTVGVSLVATFLFIAGAYIFGKYVPSLLGNPIVQLGLWSLGILTVGYRLGGANRQKVLGRTTEAIFRHRDGQVTFKGKLVKTPGQEETGYYFVPFKGTRVAGHQWEPYRVKDLGRQFVEAAQVQRAGEQAAVIFLHPAETTVSETDYGTRIVTRTGQLEPAETAQATLRTTLPEYDDQTLNDYANRLDEVQKEKEEYRRERNKYHRKWRRALAEDEQPVDELVEERLKQAAQFTAIANGQGRSPQQNGEGDDSGPGFTGPGLAGAAMGNGSDLDQQVADVEEEVSDDE